MGFNNQKRKIRDSIDKWKCIGRFGYGEGRCITDMGKDAARGKSVCYDLCNKKEQCRQQHFVNMDERFPITAQLVKMAVHEAKKVNMPVIKSVIRTMQVAYSQGNPEVVQIRKTLIKYGASGMTDHYVMGQLENFDNGLKKLDPATPPDVQLVSPVDHLSLSSAPSDRNGNE